MSWTYNPFTTTLDKTLSNTEGWVTAPVGPTSPGVVGQKAYDSSYIYICVATNTWKRASISTWVAANYYLLLEDDNMILLETEDKLVLEN